jgi:hypothetical protein
MKENRMDGACSMLGKHEECIQNINQKPRCNILFCKPRNKYKVNIRMDLEENGVRMWIISFDSG